LWERNVVVVGVEEEDEALEGKNKKKVVLGLGKKAGVAGESQDQGVWLLR
jgi:hypothetical protein